MSDPGVTLIRPELERREIELGERNEFQIFVRNTIGRDLPLFGVELFRFVLSTFAPVDNVPVTPDYVIGPGDELYMRGWGQVDIDYRAFVDRNGTISIPKVGVIEIAGTTYQDLQPLIFTTTPLRSLPSWGCGGERN